MSKGNPYGYGDKIPQSVAQAQAEGIIPIAWAGGKKGKHKVSKGKK